MHCFILSFFVMHWNEIWSNNMITVSFDSTAIDNTCANHNKLEERPTSMCFKSYCPLFLNCNRLLLCLLHCGKKVISLY